MKIRGSLTRFSDKMKKKLRLRNGDPGPAGADGDDVTMDMISTFMTPHFPEFVGPPGSTGPMGPSGPQGIVGPTGLTGPQGLPGITKRVDVLTGITDTNGDVSFSFAAFPAVPICTPMFIAPNANTYLRLTSITTTSCSYKMEARGGLTVLGLTLLAFAVTNVPGVTVKLKVEEV